VWDARASARLYTSEHLDKPDAVRANAHPIGRAGKESPFENRTDEARLLEAPVDPQSVRQRADYFLAQLDRAGPKESRLPRPATLSQTGLGPWPDVRGLDWRPVTHRISRTFGRLRQTSGDRLPGETKHRQELNQPTRLPRHNRSKFPCFGVMDARLEHADRLADWTSVDAIFHGHAVTRPHRRDGRHDDSPDAGSDDLWRPGRVRAVPP